MASAGLPDKLCDLCKIEITKFYVFKQKSKRTAQVLLDMIKDSGNALETSSKSDNIANKCPEKSDTDIDISQPDASIPCKPTYCCDQCDKTFSSEKQLNLHYKMHFAIEETQKESAYIKLESIEENTDDLLQILDDTMGSIADEEDADEDNNEEEQIIENNEEDYQPDDSMSEMLIIDAATEENEDIEFDSYNGEYDEDIKPSTTINCSICDKYFLNANELEIHFATHEEEFVILTNTFTCPVCLKDFALESERLDHMNEHHDGGIENEHDRVDQDEISVDELYQSTAAAEVDDVYSEEEVQLLENTPIVDAEINYECACGMLLADKNAYTEHCNNTHDFFCNHCTQIFLTEKEFKQHMSAAHRGLYTCKHCGKKLKNQAQYEQHNKVHESINVINNYLTFYPCHKCQIIYWEESSLQVHLTNVHQADEQKKDIDESCVDYQFLDEDNYEEGHYSCGVCGQVSANSNDAKFHVIVHSKKFTCPYEDCGCEYDQFSRFTIHIMTKHINGNSHTCTHCSLPFDSYDDLQWHMKNNCKERKFACTHCGM